MKKQALEKWPNAKWVEYEPVTGDNAIEGAQAGVRPASGARIPDFEKAKVDSGARFGFPRARLDDGLPMKQFSKARRAGEPNETEMNRLYVGGVELLDHGRDGGSPVADAIERSARRSRQDLARELGRIAGRPESSE